MNEPIKVNYEYTNNLYRAGKWLEALPDLFAADFETASRFDEAAKEQLLHRLGLGNLDFNEKRTIQQKIDSDGLSHPSLAFVTHLSVGWSDCDAKVIVCDTDHMRKLVFNFLTSTDKTQLWHNAVFDFKHIYYAKQKLPKYYKDTQLLAKTLLNDADDFKNHTNLKELMAYCYGDWALSKDSFTQEEMWNEDMIRYAATDSCATFKLYQDIIEEL